MKRYLFRHWLCVSLLGGLLLGWAIPSWAGIYLSYASGSELFLVDGTNCAGGVTVAMQSYPDRRIVFTDSAGKTAESTIKAWSGGAVTFDSEIVTDGDMEAVGTANWTLNGVDGVVSKSGTTKYADAQSLQIVRNTDGQVYQNVTLTVGTLYYCNYWTYTDTVNAAGLFAGVAGGGVGYLNLRNTLTKQWSNLNGFFTPAVAACSVAVGNTASGTTNWNDNMSLKPLTSPGGNGCLLGPVTMQSGFNPNKITHFQIMGRPDPRGRDRTKTRILYDSRYQ